MEFIRKKRRRNILVLGILAILLLALFIVNIGIGSVSISPLEVVRELKSTLMKQVSTNEVYNAIIWKIRLPRTLAAILGGSALAVAGLLLQIFFRNPLVGPYVLGISSGATLSTALILLAGWTFGATKTTSWLLFGAAFVGSISIMIVVLLVSRRVKSIITLLVIGLMAGYLTGSITSVLIAFAEKNEVQGFVMWTMGSFGGFTWEQVKILAFVSLPILVVTLLLSKPLNAFLLGENYALSMGVKVIRMRWLIILTSSILAAVVTAFSGPVAFIGLAVPHIARLSFGTMDNKLLIPGTILIGGIATATCDLIARTLFSPIEIPLSAVTSFIGAPIIIVMLLKRRHTL